MVNSFFDDVDTLDLGIKRVFSFEKREHAFLNNIWISFNLKIIQTISLMLIIACCWLFPGLYSSSNWTSLICMYISSFLFVIIFSILFIMSIYPLSMPFNDAFGIALSCFIHILLIICSVLCIENLGVSEAISKYLGILFAFFPICFLVNVRMFVKIHLESLSQSYSIQKGNIVSSLSSAHPNLSNVTYSTPRFQLSTLHRVLLICLHLLGLNAIFHSIYTLLQVSSELLDSNSVDSNSLKIPPFFTPVLLLFTPFTQNLLVESNNVSLAVPFTLTPSVFGIYFLICVAIVITILSHPTNRACFFLPTFSFSRLDSPSPKQISYLLSVLREQLWFAEENIPLWSAMHFFHNSICQSDQITSQSGSEFLTAFSIGNSNHPLSKFIQLPPSIQIAKFGLTYGGSASLIAMIHPIGASLRLLAWFVRTCFGCGRVSNKHSKVSFWRYPGLIVASIVDFIRLISVDLPVYCFARLLDLILLTSHRQSIVFGIEFIFAWLYTISLLSYPFRSSLGKALNYDSNILHSPIQQFSRRFLLPWALESNNMLAEDSNGGSHIIEVLPHRYGPQNLMPLGMDAGIRRETIIAELIVALDVSGVGLALERFCSGIVTHCLIRAAQKESSTTSSSMISVVAFEAEVWKFLGLHQFSFSNPNDAINTLAVTKNLNRTKDIKLTWKAFDEDLALKDVADGISISTDNSNFVMHVRYEGKNIQSENSGYNLTFCDPLHTTTNHEETKIFTSLNHNNADESADYIYLDHCTSALNYWKSVLSLVHPHLSIGDEGTHKARLALDGIKKSVDAFINLYEIRKSNNAASSAGGAIEIPSGSNTNRKLAVDKQKRLHNVVSELSYFAEPTTALEMTSRLISIEIINLLRDITRLDAAERLSSIIQTNASHEDVDLLEVKNDFSPVLNGSNSGNISKFKSPGKRKAAVFSYLCEFLSEIRYLGCGVGDFHVPFIGNNLMTLSQIISKEFGECNFSHQTQNSNGNKDSNNTFVNKDDSVLISSLITELRDSAKKYGSADLNIPKTNPFIQCGIAPCSRNNLLDLFPSFTNVQFNVFDALNPINPSAGHFMKISSFSQANHEVKEDTQDLPMTAEDGDCDLDQKYDQNNFNEGQSLNEGSSDNNKPLNHRVRPNEVDLKTAKNFFRAIYNHGIDPNCFYANDEEGNFDEDLQYENEANAEGILNPFGTLTNKILKTAFENSCNVLGIDIERILRTKRPIFKDGSNSSSVCLDSLVMNSFNANDSTSVASSSSRRFLFPIDAMQTKYNDKFSNEYSLSPEKDIELKGLDSKAPAEGLSINRVILSDSFNVSGNASALDSFQQDLDENSNPKNKTGKTVFTNKNAEFENVNLPNCIEEEKIDSNSYNRTVEHEIEQGQSINPPNSLLATKNSKHPVSKVNFQSTIQNIIIPPPSKRPNLTIIPVKANRQMAFDIALKKIPEPPTSSVISLSPLYLAARPHFSSRPFWQRSLLFSCSVQPGQTSPTRRLTKRFQNVHPFLVTLIDPKSAAPVSPHRIAVSIQNAPIKVLQNHLVSKEGNSVKSTTIRVDSSQIEVFCPLKASVAILDDKEILGNIQSVFAECFYPNKNNGEVGKISNNSVMNKINDNHIYDGGSAGSPSFASLSAPPSPPLFNQGNGVKISNTPLESPDNFSKVNASQQSSYYGQNSMSFVSETSPFFAAIAAAHAEEQERPLTPTFTILQKLIDVLQSDTWLDPRNFDAFVLDVLSIPPSFAAYLSELFNVNKASSFYLSPDVTELVTLLANLGLLDVGQATSGVRLATRLFKSFPYSLEETKGMFSALKECEECLATSLEVEAQRLQLFRHEALRRQISIPDSQIIEGKLDLKKVELRNGLISENKTKQNEADNATNINNLMEEIFTSNPTIEQLPEGIDSDFMTPQTTNRSRINNIPYLSSGLNGGQVKYGSNFESSIMIKPPVPAKSMNISEFKQQPSASNRSPLRSLGSDLIFYPNNSDLSSNNNLSFIKNIDNNNNNPHTNGEADLRYIMLPRGRRTVSKSMARRDMPGPFRNGLGFSGQKFRSREEHSKKDNLINGLSDKNPLLETEDDSEGYLAEIELYPPSVDREENRNVETDPNNLQVKIPSVLTDNPLHSSSNPYYSKEVPKLISSSSSLLYPPSTSLERFSLEELSSLLESELASTLDSSNTPLVPFEEFLNKNEDSKGIFPLLEPYVNMLLKGIAQVEGAKPDSFIPFPLHRKKFNTIATARMASRTRNSLRRQKQSKGKKLLASHTYLPDLSLRSGMKTASFKYDHDPTPSASRGLLSRLDLNNQVNNRQGSWISSNARQTNARIMSTPFSALLKTPGVAANLLVDTPGVSTQYTTLMDNSNKLGLSRGVFNRALGFSNYLTNHFELLSKRSKSCSQWSLPFPTTNAPLSYILAHLTVEKQGDQVQYISRNPESKDVIRKSIQARLQPIISVAIRQLNLIFADHLRLSATFITQLPRILSSRFNRVNKAIKCLKFILKEEAQISYSMRKAAGGRAQFDAVKALNQLDNGQKPINSARPSQLGESSTGSRRVSGIQAFQNQAALLMHELTRQMQNNIANIQNQTGGLLNSGRRQTALKKKDKINYQLWMPNSDIHEEAEVKRLHRRRVPKALKKKIPTLHSTFPFTPDQQKPSKVNNEVWSGNGYPYYLKPPALIPKDNELRRAFVVHTGKWNDTRSYSYSPVLKKTKKIV